MGLLPQMVHSPLEFCPVKNRLAFWCSVVLPSLLWGLETTRDQTHTAAYEKLVSCQHDQVVKMLKCKRRSDPDGRLEPWQDYRIRSLRIARDLVRKQQISVLDARFDKKSFWAAHVERRGAGPRESRQLMTLLAWRCKYWWNEQVLYNDLNWDPVKHSAGIGRPRRWEQPFSSNLLLSNDIFLHMPLF